ncbi:MAG: hypothetical protein LN411_04385 [Candidatus Thermoplasmatota archaeon]|nr:hypothetical protein [Candidatus Thermoplasmatota archaeon]
MSARAFCPGHITGFFEICRMDNLLASGSRGGGLCTSLGALSEVSIEKADRLEIDVSIDGEPREAEVTRAALGHLLGDEQLHVNVITELDLPESQGFGMSAAGALSACIAASHSLGISRQNAFEATHFAEIECGAGLGDVPAIHRAGVTIRESPGLPPAGKIHRIEEAPEVVLAVVGPPIKTSDMLKDVELAQRINRGGAERVSQLLSRPTVDELMRLASSFTLETDLASERVIAAMDAASAAGVASMVMLGNSVFAIGRMEKLVDILSAFGEVKSCSVDSAGARVLPNQT